MQAKPTSPHHGGRLRQAASHYGRPLGEWLDLSTGVNPTPYPHLEQIDPQLWLRLPEEEDGLAEVAAAYYSAPNALAVAGSQAAIQLLPLLRPPSRVGIITPGYAEHAHAWDRHGHRLTPLPGQVEAIEATIDNLDVLLLINPNNPTAKSFPPEQLLSWHKRLAVRGGWLIVDEAFIDCTPELSVASYTERTGLIVLRSLGKFFGLAGARVGFLLAAPELLQRSAYELGPWTLSGPARELARRALGDQAWQAANRDHLLCEGERLYQLLASHQLTPHGHTALFSWLHHSDAQALHEELAELGIFTRLFSEPSSLRFGLPANEQGWQRLQQALYQITEGDR